MTNLDQEMAGPESTGRLLQALFAPLAQRLRGPGGLYNLGNAIGFVGGLAAAIAAIPQADFSLSAALAAAADFVSGSPAASALTLATLVFFWSGEEYHRAWAHGFPPEEAKIRSGDLSSAVGAVLLAFAFFALGNLLLALTAGVMHAAGKLGSAWAASRAARDRSFPFRFGTACRDMVLLSRLPAMAMALNSLLLSPGAGAGTHFMSAVLLACCLVWAAADMLLLPAESLFSPARWRRAA